MLCDSRGLFVRLCVCVTVFSRSQTCTYRVTDLVVNTLIVADVLGPARALRRVHTHTSVALRFDLAS